ncbi:hypothetical protein [Intrasporangium sp. YIM S08009]|uniref:hypothetical protein n=1 Tax=Intrasporangium zincisolvens TaxID=3080018 RepID=UPI002B05A7F5|nr:hypothetical protein [Intrasporangium sp. YIM S08009]
MSADAAAEVVRAAVGIWSVAVPADVTALGAHLAALDAAERRRVSETTVASVAASRAAGYLLVRRVVGEVLGVPPAGVALDRTCPRCGEPHGRVRVATDTGLHVSVTHVGRAGWPEAPDAPDAPDAVRSRPRVVAVAVTRLAPVGIDLVRTGEADFPGFDAVALHPDDEPAGDAVARARAWARKEAALKAVGTGLDVDPASFAAPLPGVPTPVGPDRVPVAVADLDDLHEPAVLSDPPGLVGAVALARADASVPVVVLGGSASLVWRPSGQAGRLASPAQSGQPGRP